MTSSQCKVYGLRGVKPTMWKKTKKTENFLGRVGWVIFLRDPILIIHGQHALLYYKWQKQPPSSETQILLDSSGYEWPGLKFGTFCALFLQCWLATWTTTSKQMMYFTTYIRKQARGVPRVLSCNIEQTGATLTSIILRYWSTTHTGFSGLHKKTAAALHAFMQKYTQAERMHSRAHTDIVRLSSTAACSEPICMAAQRALG